MRRTAIASAIAWVALGLTANDAHARCGSPSGTFSPGTGAAIPRRAVVYLFWPAREAPEVVARDGDGRPISTLRIEELPGAPAYQVFAIHMDAAEAQEVHVEAARRYPDRPFRPTTASYRVDPDWRPAPSPPVAVTSASHTRYSWMCSSNNTRDLALNTHAAAWEVSIGGRRAFLAPTSYADFWDRGGRRSAAPGFLRLGYANCFGDTGDWTGLSRITVRGLRPDGSVIPSAGSTWVLSPGLMALACFAAFLLMLHAAWRSGLLGKVIAIVAALAALAAEGGGVLFVALDAWTVGWFGCVVGALVVAPHLFRTRARRHLRACLLCLAFGALSLLLARGYAPLGILPVAGVLFVVVGLLITIISCRDQQPPRPSSRSA